jgi:hypothetical protein
MSSIQRVMLPTINLIMSQQIDFVRNSAEVLASAKNIVKTDGITVNGKTVQLKACGNAKMIELLEKMSESELTEFVTSLGWNEDYVAPTRSTDEVSVDLSAETSVEFETEKGQKVPCIELEYIGTSNDNNFKFAMSNGTLVTGIDTLRELASYGGLNVGDKILFKPESVKATKNAGYFIGIPNFRANPRIAQVLAYHKDLNQQRKTYRARLSKAGYSKEQIAQKIDEKFGAQLSQGISVPSAPSFS